MHQRKLPDVCRETGQHVAGAERCDGDQKRRHDAAAIGEPPHEDAADREAKHHQGIGEPGRPHVSRKDGIVGSNPTTLTILLRATALRRIVTFPRAKQDALRSFSEGGLHSMFYVYLIESIAFLANDMWA